MSHRRPTENLSRDLGDSLGRSNEIFGRHDYGVVGNQNSASLGAIVNPDTPAAGIFQLAVRGKVLRHAKGVRHSQVVHYDALRHGASKQTTTIVAATVRFRTLEFHPNNTFPRGVASPSHATNVFVPPSGTNPVTTRGLT